MAITINGLKGLANRVTGRSGRRQEGQTTLIMQTVHKLTDSKPGKVPRAIGASHRTPSG